MHRYYTLDRRQYVRVCECGCGQPTLIAWGSDPEWGRRHMQPQRFIYPHQLRGHEGHDGGRRGGHRPNQACVAGDIAYIQLAGGKSGVPLEAIIDAVDLPRVLARARWWAQWSPQGDTHYVCASKGLLLHRFILAAPPELVVDHKNHDGLDCRRENMRLCTRAQNNQNRRGADRRSKTGIRGVRWDKSRRCWRVQVGIDGRRVHIGRFTDLREAEAAAIAARRRLLTHTLN